jgi:dihydropyrimidinase
MHPQPQVPKAQGRVTAQSVLLSGRKLRGWPVNVLSRGRVIVADGKRSVDAGFGRFLARTGGEAAKPTGRLVSDVDPEQNFGSTLL